MQLGRLRLGHRSPEELERLLEEARGAELSYRHRGSTLEGGAPVGVRKRTFVREVDGSLAAARAALAGWALHRGISARPHPAEAPLVEGESLLVVIPFGPLEVAVPNRIVAMVDEPTRFGFAYGTLEGHDEAGEELFLAEQVAPGRLRLRIVVHAIPASSPARVAGVLVVLLSDLAARRYLSAWSAAIASAS